MESLPMSLLELSLTSAELELQYEASKHSIELLAREEEIRKLRAEQFLVEDDAEDLRDQLHHEQQSSDRIKLLVDEHLVRAQNAEALLEQAEQTQRKQKHELERLRLENASLKSTTQTSSTVLAEKLALASELSIVRPELEHLRAQAAIVEQLRTEKLAFQRQLSDAQCDIETARAEAKRAHAKRRNTNIEIAQEEQVSDLKRELARERRLRKNAEELAQSSQIGLKSDDVRRQLTAEKSAREKLEQEIEDLRSNTEVEDVRRELLKVKKNNHRLQEQLDNIRDSVAVEKVTASITTTNAVERALETQLDVEREARTTAEVLAKAREDQLVTEKAHLEDKLNLFRTKLREKKEELKNTKTELATMKENAAASAKIAADLEPVKALIKKTAARKPQVKVADETTLGTPGDGPQGKRRQAKANVGEKSSFSITPFLNKTVVLDMDDAADDASPTANKRPVLPLTSAASIKGNRQSTQKSIKLAAVEEADEPVSQKVTVPLNDNENVPPGDEEVKKVTAKPKQNHRKSLVDFKSFQTDDATVKQKKRRLGLASTLFDEEDAGNVKSSTGLFGATAYAKLATVKKGAASIRGSALGRSALLSATDGSGFQFSPLKRARRNLDDTLRG